MKVKGFKGRDYLEHVVDMEAGEAFSVALLGNGSVYTWGDNSYGQLGSELVATTPVTDADGNVTIANYSTTPVQVNSGEYSVDHNAQFRVLSGVYMVSAGRHHVVSVAMENDWNETINGGMGGYVREPAAFAWGDGTQGQLGNLQDLTAITIDGVAKNIAPSARKVSGIDGVTAVAAGGAHTLVRSVNEAGEVRLTAFGSNDFKQLTNGTPDANGYVTAVAGEWVRTKADAKWLDEVSIITAGGSFSAVMMENGRS